MNFELSVALYLVRGDMGELHRTYKKWTEGTSCTPNRAGGPDGFVKSRMAEAKRLILAIF